jgi:hypothetical protein
MIFLVVYDRSRAELIELRAYENTDRHLADSDRLELELSLDAAQSQIEIVHFDANTEADLRKTHRRYFESVESIAATPID